MGSIFSNPRFRNLGTTVWKRNERERYRVRCVNDGYEKLRNRLPIKERWVYFDALVLNVLTRSQSSLAIKHLSIETLLPFFWWTFVCFFAISWTVNRSILVRSVSAKSTLYEWLFCTSNIWKSFWPMPATNILVLVSIISNVLRTLHKFSTGGLWFVQYSSQ